MVIKPNSKHRFGGSIRPESAEVYYEDGVPYLKYVGKTYVNNNEVRISIPKISLHFENVSIESKEETYRDMAGKDCTIYYRQQCYVAGQDKSEYTILPVELTLDEIGNAFGYPVVIKADC